MKIGYADPPYVGCAYLYKDHPDFAGEVDHVALVAQLEAEFDGWVLHTSATPTAIAVLAPLVVKTGARWCSWVKGFAAFKRNVCHWAFELLGARPDDELADLFPGTGAVSKHWATWQGKFTLPPFQLAAE